MYSQEDSRRFSSAFFSSLCFFADLTGRESVGNFFLFFSCWFLASLGASRGGTHTLTGVELGGLLLSERAGTKSVDE